MASWKPTTDAKYGVVVYNFDGNVAHGLRLTIGETVHIFEECCGWYRGCTLRNKAVKGIFPMTYVHIKECTMEKVGTLDETVVPKEDATVKELTSVLREWFVLWKEMYKTRQERLFEALKTIMWDLVECRQKLLSGTLTQDQMDNMKKKAITKIDWGNSKMGLDLIPRVDGEVVEVDSMSVVDLYKVHVSSAEANLQVSGRGNFKKQVSRISTVMHHIHLSMTDFVCNMEDHCQVFFSIYDARKAKFISERFLVAIAKSDSSLKVNQPQKFENKTCLFTDLSNNDVLTEAYLVAHIVRVGRMLTDGSTKKIAPASYRRPYGCAVLDIVDVLSGKEEQLEDREMPVYTCNDGDFWAVHDSIIKKNTSKYSVPSSTSGIYVSLRMFYGDLEKVQIENPLLLPKLTAVVRRLGFPEIIMPGDVRNDVYVTLERGEFEKGSGKTTSKNVEVSMSVVGPNGRVIEDCIFLGAGGSSLSEYQSTIFYHNSNPKWNETIKIQLPSNKISGSHLRFGFRHLSKFEDKEKVDKTFGFSFLSLMRPDGTTVADKSHDLCVYKFDGNCFYDSKTYLHMPSSLSEALNRANSSADRLARNMRDTFVVRTTVCSTKLTQNVDLVGLLRWKAQKREIPAVLTSLLKIDGEEIVKFLQDIFDALFSILNASAEDYGHLVFQALVFIICILSNEKYQHFQAVLTTYIEKHFSGAIAHKKLISCLRQTLRYNAEKIEELKKTMMALEYLFKFIMQSGILCIRMYEDGQVAFKKDLCALFSDLNLLMSNRLCDVTVQVLALQHFAGIYHETLKVFSVEEVSVIAREFLNSTTKDQKALNSGKLQFIEATVNSELFIHNVSRKILMPVLVAHLHQQLAQKQEMRACAEILGSILTSLQKETSQTYKDEDLYLAVKVLLQPVFQTVMTVDRTSELARHFLSVLTNFLFIMKEEHYRRYLKEFPSKKELRDFLVNVFVVFTDIVKRGIFLRDWIVIIILANSVILTAIQYFSQALVDSFSAENFDYQLWNSYFNLSVSFLTQSCLQLENFTEVKRNKIIDRYGDMRQVIGFEIVHMWESLGTYRSYFVLSLVSPFLEMTLVPETDLRKATLPIFFDMVGCELKTKGSTAMVENKIVNELDRLVSVDKKGDREYKELFKKILSQKFQGQLSYCAEGLAFVNRVTDLLELLLEYRRISAEDDRDQKMSCLVNLLEFYKSIEREDMYIRCINRLCDLHIVAENFTEAGYTVLKHAELLQWSHKPVRDVPDSPTAFELKEKLYLDAIEFLDKGKTWEKAIELCKELAEQYETMLNDYVKLGNILKQQAKFFDNIVKHVRPECEYFRVGFYGRGFPLSIRNKAFVYRGQAYEKLGSFNQRIQAQFPDAQMMDKNTPPEDDILQSDGQYLQCCRVNPISEHEDRFAGKAVNEKISGFYRVNDVKRFTNSRRIRRGPKDKDNEFATMWLERTTHTITTSLPGILRWFQVATSDTVDISPILNAVETVESKNKELETIITRLCSDCSQSINPLSMILNGVIDAAVMGGIAKYEEAFFNPEYLKKNVADKQLVDRLKKAIQTQVKVLERGLALHDRLATKDLRPFHSKMETCFSDMKTRISGEKTKPKEPRPLPPTPLAESPSMSSAKKKTRKHSLPADLGLGTLPATKPRRQSELNMRQTLWYDTDGRGNEKGELTNLGAKTLWYDTDGRGNEKGLSGSKSLEALTELDEVVPPVPRKGSKPNQPTDHHSAVPRRNPSPERTPQRRSSPAELLGVRTPQRRSSPAELLGGLDPSQTNGDASPALPPKRKSVVSPSDSRPFVAPPLPSCASLEVAVSEADSWPGSLNTSFTEDAVVPALPPKSSSRMSVAAGEEAGVAPVVPEKRTRPSTLHSTESGANPIPLPEKRNSYASTISSRTSSVFSPSPLSDKSLDFASLPSSFNSSQSQDQPSNHLTEVLPSPLLLDSSVGPGLMPKPSLASPDSTLSPSTPYSPESNGYSFVTPPLTPTSSKFGYDYVSSPRSSVASWVSENTRYFSASSSFDSDVFSPGTPLKCATLPFSSTPLVEHLVEGTSPTKNELSPPLLPSKGGRHFAVAPGDVSSQLTCMHSRDIVTQPSPSRPVPAPRRNTLASFNRTSSSIARSCSDASDFQPKTESSASQVTMPPATTPRRSVALQSDCPPPKPPRRSLAQEPPPPPKPQPYSSRSVASSPVSEGKPIDQT